MVCQWDRNPEISLNWVVSFKIYFSPLSTMLFPISEFFEKSQMSEFFYVSGGEDRNGDES